MDYFVHIQPVYQNEAERTVEYLAAHYQNHDFLVGAIDKLIQEKLPPEVIEGKRVLLKPNWVLHDRKEADAICMRTHNNVTLATLEVLLAKRPQHITVGDAPVQGCKWGKVVTDSFLAQVDELRKRFQVPIAIKDFRRVTFNPKDNRLENERKPLSEYVIFDLGKDSHLEEITVAGKNQFRVTDYHPERLAESHAPGMHKYCITRALFEHDVVISMPKVKTHQKAGLTNALKNIVGLNGDKDYLPHHRVGGTEVGGDCYPGANALMRLSEKLMDVSNRHRGEWHFKWWRRLSVLVWRLSFPSKEQSLGAGWYGNDTTWRMVMDLNQIVAFGREDGTIASHTQRTLYHLCDGIVGGQGDGPLQPDPLPLGILCFSNYAPTTDIAMGHLMQYPVEKVSLLRNAMEKSKCKAVTVKWKEKSYPLEQLFQFSLPTLPPPGWVNYFNRVR